MKWNEIPRVYRWAAPVAIVMMFMIVANARGGLYTRGRRLMAQAGKVNEPGKTALINKAIDFWQAGLGSTVNTHQRIWCVNGLRDVAGKNARAAEILFDYYEQNLNSADPWEQTDAIKWLGKSGKKEAVARLVALRANAKTSSSADRRLRYLVDAAFAELKKAGVTGDRP